MSLIGQSASAFAPASTGNLSVGFDLLGGALERLDGQPLGDRVRVTFAAADSLSNSGDYAHVCPEDKAQNLAWQAYRLFRARLKQDDFPKVKMTLTKSLPVGSGLGSSACSVVAALTALNRLFAEPYSDAQLLHLMGEVEAKASGSLHYDNVAPSYFGGLQLMSPNLDSPTIALPVPESWYLVVAYPGFAFATKTAREALPAQYDKPIAIENAQHLSAFVAHLYRNEAVEAAQVIKDVLAEPYRGPVIQGFVETKQALVEQGALAVGISGAGPTLFAITTEKAKAKAFESYLAKEYLINGTGFVHICRIARLGAKQLD
mgnify:CR=1 FL=1